MRTVQKGASIMITAALTFVLVLSLATMASAGDSNSDVNANIQQNANVDGGEMEVHQESTVQKSDGDGTVVERSEQHATKESGGDAQVERNNQRFVNGEEDEFGPNVEQQVEEGDNSLSVSQQHTTDDADTGDAFDTDPQVNTETDTDTMSETDAAYEEAESVDGDGTTAATEAATGTSDADVSPLRQGGSLAIVQGVVDSLLGALTGLFR